MKRQALLAILNRIIQDSQSAESQDAIAAKKIQAILQGDGEEVAPREHIQIFVLLLTLSTSNQNIKEIEKNLFPNVNLQLIRNNCDAQQLANLQGNSDEILHHAPIAETQEIAAQFVHPILQHDAKIILQENKEGLTPLEVAVRAGNDFVVLAMFNAAKTIPVKLISKILDYLLAQKNIVSSAKLLIFLIVGFPSCFDKDYQEKILNYLDQHSRTVKELIQNFPFHEHFDLGMAITVLELPGSHVLRELIDKLVMPKSLRVYGELSVDEKTITKEMMITILRYIKINDRSRTADKLFTFIPAEHHQIIIDSAFDALCTINQHDRLRFAVNIDYLLGKGVGILAHHETSIGEEKLKDTIKRRKLIFPIKDISETVNKFCHESKDKMKKSKAIFNSAGLLAESSSLTHLWNVLSVVILSHQITHKRHMFDARFGFRYELDNYFGYNMLANFFAIITAVDKCDWQEAIEHVLAGVVICSDKKFEHDADAKKVLHALLKIFFIDNTEYLRKREYQPFIDMFHWIKHSCLPCRQQKIFNSLFNERELFFNEMRKSFDNLLVFCDFYSMTNCEFVKGGRIEELMSRWKLFHHATSKPLSKKLMLLPPPAAAPVVADDKSKSAGPAPK